MAKEPKTPEKDVTTPTAGKKNSVIIDINPTLESVDLLRFNRTAVVAFVRMSPPTKDYDAFVDRLYDLAVEHDVEEPRIYIRNSGNEPVSTDEDNGHWLAFEDARLAAVEAYGEVIRPESYDYLGAMIEDVQSKFTHVVVLLPESDLKLYQQPREGVDLVPFSIDEESIALRMFGLVKAGEFANFANELSDGAQYVADDLVDLYQVYDEDDADLEETVLNYSQRLKRAQAFRRIKRKVAVARERMRKKIATTDQLKKRARKKAIQAIRKKVAGAHGADYQNLGVGEKIQIDKRVEQRKGSIGRIAAKILPQLRKQELTKLAKAHAMKNQHESVDQQQLSIAGKPGDEAPTKKNWHQMFHPDGRIKLDKRFKIWRQIIDQEDIIEAVNDAHDPEIAAVLEALLTKADEYNIDPAVIRELFDRGASEGAYDISPIEEGFQRVNSFIAGNYFIEDLALMERAEEGACAVITRDELKELEKFADALLDKFGIDIEFTKHFGERMSDSRNSPCITVKELRDFFRKLALTQGKGIKNAREAQIVLKDMQRDLNIPVVIDYNRGEFEVTLKTIMRKKNFTTPNQIVKV